MSGLLERIRRGERLVGDGAMGTMLMARGLEPGACPERWNLDRPEVLEEIARNFSIEEQPSSLPYGDIAPETMAAAFERQIGALIEAGVDLICVETMTDLAEARLAIGAARRQSPTMPICATMTFDPTPNGFFTVMGTNIEQAVTGLSEAGADIIGSNCGNGIDNMVSIAQTFRRYTQLPLIIQSNAGLPEIVDGTLRYGETPEFMAERTRKLLDLGVNIVGGCCGTTPEHIAAIRRVVDAYHAAT